MSTKLPQLKDMIKLGISPFLVFMLNYSAYHLYAGLYEKFSADTLLHFLGGLSIAYSAYQAIYLAEKNDWMMIKKPYLKAFIIIATVILAAVVWEMYEFSSDQFLGTNYQPSNADTMKDLIMGMLGGIIFCLSFIWRKK